MNNPARTNVPEADRHFESIILGKAVSANPKMNAAKKPSTIEKAWFWPG
jgi:hypothetical protein